MISAEEILAMSPDGVMLSNGPGDPEEVNVALDMIKGVLGNIPFLAFVLVISYLHYLKVLKHLR